MIPNGIKIVNWLICVFIAENLIITIEQDVTNALYSLEIKKKKKVKSCEIKTYAKSVGNALRKRVDLNVAIV